MSGDSISAKPWVDRPKPRFPWPVWLFAIGFWVFFTFVPAGAASSYGLLAAVGWVGMSVVGGAFIASTYFAVRYELDDRTLRARASVNRAQLELAEIEEVDIIPWYSFVLPRNWGALLINSWKPMLRIVDSGGARLLLTPTDPEEMRAEILRRRDRLRGGSGAAG